MPVITVERAATAKGTIDNLVSQGKSLFEDITDTAHEVARLAKEAEARELELMRAHERSAKLQARVDELEMMLDSVRATVEMVKPNGTNGNAARREPHHRAAGSPGI
jgi:phage shock protein A